MARAFRATTNGYRADLESHERRLLSQLCADVITMLENRGRQLGEDAVPAGADDDFVHFRRELAGLGGDFDDSTEPDGVAPPEDAALARLLPDASTDPEEAARLFAVRGE